MTPSVVAAIVMTMLTAACSDGDIETASPTSPTSPAETTSTSAVDATTQLDTTSPGTTPTDVTEPATTPPTEPTGPETTPPETPQPPPELWAVGPDPNVPYTDPPLDGLSPQTVEPKACGGATPAEREPVMVALNTLPFTDVVPPTYPGAEVARTAQIPLLEAPGGPIIEITISATDATLIDEYIATARMCFESTREEIDASEPEVARIDEAVLAALAKLELDPTMLAQARRKMIRTGVDEDFSLAMILIELGVDPAAVVEIAEQLSGVPAQSIVDLLNAPSAPLTQLVVPAEVTQLLTDIARDSLIVEFAVVGDPAGIVNFVVDPPLANGRYVAYIAKCSTAARARIHADGGAATVTMFYPTKRVGQQSHNASAPPNETWLWGYSKSAKGFDVVVQATKNGTDYELYGSWYEGSGGGCAK